MNQPRSAAPKPSVRRLSLYLRQLELLQEQDVRTVSSGRLSQPLGLSDAQVRKDLAYFGQFGRSGVGYEVAELIEASRAEVAVAAMQETSWLASRVGLQKQIRLVSIFRISLLRNGS